MSSLTTSTSTHPEEESLEEKRTSVSSGRASRAEITWSNPPLDGIVPSARGGHSAILANTQLIIFGGHYFGGHGKFVYLNDIHRLDLETSTWHEVRAGGEPPAPRYGHSAVLVGETKMFIFGGKGDNGQVFRDMYYLDLTDSTWYIVNWTTDAPSGRFGHACVALDTQIVIQGGWDGKKSMEDFWVFDTDNFNWIKPKTSGNSPGPRHNHVMAFTKDGRIIVYGGYIVTSDTLPQYNKDTYFLDSESMKWTRPRVTGDYPIGTFGHTIALHEDIAFVLGGWSGTERHPIFMGDKKVKENAKILAREERLQSGQSSVKDFSSEFRRSKYLHVLDLNTNEWHTPKMYGVEVTTRYGHTCTIVGPHLFIFGGWDGNRALNSLLVGEFSE